MSTTAQHTATCTAYAVGCAVENLRDAVAQCRTEGADPADLLALSPVTVGGGYLTDGTVSCFCASGVSEYGAATLAAGHRALALAAEAAVRDAETEVQAAQHAEREAALATRAAEARRDALRADLEAARAEAVAANRAQRKAERAAETVETFTCTACGDVEHPVTPGDDDSLWCECGARLDEQRERVLDDMWAERAERAAGA